MVNQLLKRLRAPDEEVQLALKKLKVQQDAYHPLKGAHSLLAELMWGPTTKVSKPRRIGGDKAKSLPCSKGLQVERCITEALLGQCNHSGEMQRWVQRAKEALAKLHFTPVASQVVVPAPGLECAPIIDFVGYRQPPRKPKQLCVVELKCGTTAGSRRQPTNSPTMAVPWQHIPDTWRNRQLAQLELQLACLEEFLQTTNPPTQGYLLMLKSPDTPARTLKAEGLFQFGNAEGKQTPPFPTDSINSMHHDIEVTKQSD